MKKITTYTLAASLVLGLGSCTSEDFWDTFDRTVDGPINFTVGLESASVQQASTRAEAADNTKVNLLVEGIWNRKIDEENKTGLVSKPATGTIMGTSLNYDANQTLYWDDFGTGDPDNEANNTSGLSVQAVAIEGKAETTDVSSWSALPWSTVDTGNATELIKDKKLLAKDILTASINHYIFKSTDGELNFKHALSKITVIITANAGFKQVNKQAVFNEEPTLLLTSAATAKDAVNNGAAYALTEGTINVATGKATPDDTKKNVYAATTSASLHQVVKEALVYPGTVLGSSDDVVIAHLNADGNIYYIKADRIRAAMGGNYSTEAGKNYVLKITVNKTGISMTATVTNWDTVESEVVTPKVNLTVGVGEGKKDATPTDFTAFNLWQSESKSNGYGSASAATPTGTPDGTTNWDFATPLYWENHNKHYHFRGIYPVGTPVITDDKGNQAVEVSNAAYDSDKFPSNFLMGMPEVADDETCGSTNHTPVKMSENGICAREAAINLNFRYMMSQVEVNLSSTTTNDNAKVDLTNVKVELDNVCIDGKIMLSDRSPVVTTDNKIYELPGTSSTHYHGIIIPQPLKVGTTNKVRFKITIYSDAEKKKVEDVYYADVAPIKVKVANSTDAAEATDAWKSGVHYVYNLNLTKTEIKATATLTDWKTVEASEDVWF